MQSFCVNLTEVKDQKHMWSFREFIKNSLNLVLEDDENIILADEKFVEKYFNENFGLDIKKLKDDFKEMRDMNFI